MHTTEKLTFIFLALLLTFSCDVFSQRRPGRLDITEGMKITPSGGYNLFFGDLVDKSRGSYSIGVLADRELTEILSARIKFSGGQMQGTQVFPTSGTVYASFDNIYGEFTIGGAYSPLNHLLGYFKQRTFQPYAHLNTGLVYYNSTEYWGPASERPDGEEWRSASGISPVISMGGGASVWINPAFSVNLELTGSLPFTDQIDVHDVWYNSYSDWENRINPNITEPYDFYYTFMVGISITLQDSRLKNDPRYNRKSYMKTRSYYQSKSRRSPSRRPDKKRFLFF